MFSQATKAAVVTALAVGFALLLTTLVRYSIIPQIEPQVLQSVFAVLAGHVGKDPLLSNLCWQAAGGC